LKNLAVATKTLSITAASCWSTLTKTRLCLEQPASPIAQHSTKSKASLIRERAPNHHRRWPRFPVTAPVGAALMPPRRAPCCILLIVVKPKPEQDEKGRFIAGKSGNGGRKPGSRAKLGEAFVADLCADWEKHGIETIARVREQRPHEYLSLRLLSRDSRKEKDRSQRSTRVYRFGNAPRWWWRRSIDRQRIANGGANLNQTHPSRLCLSVQALGTRS
jgi:hypothetical protein